MENFELYIVLGVLQMKDPMHYCKTTKGLKGFKVLLELIHLLEDTKLQKKNLIEI